MKDVRFDNRAEQTDRRPHGSPSNLPPSVSREVDEKLCFNELLLRGDSGLQRFQESVSNSLPDPLVEAAPSFLMKVYSVLQAMPSDSRGLVLQASSEELEKFSITCDSGADTHVLSNPETLALLALLN